MPSFGESWLPPLRATTGGVFLTVALSLAAVPSFSVTVTVMLSPLLPFPAWERSSVSVRSAFVFDDLVTSRTTVEPFFQT